MTHQKNDGLLPEPQVTEEPPSLVELVSDQTLRVTISQESIVQVDDTGTTEANWIRIEALYNLTPDGKKEPEEAVIAAVENLGNLILMAREQHRENYEFLPPFNDEEDTPPVELLEIKEDW